MNSSKTIGIVVVLGGVVALLVYYAILQSDTIFPPVASETPQPIVSSTPVVAQNTATPASAQNNTIIIAEDGQKIVWPVNNASQAENNAFADLVRKYAKKGDMITLTQCQPSPVILQIKKGQDFQVKNIDTVDSAISIVGASGVVHYVVPAQQVITIKGDSSTGTRGYYCDSSPDKSLLRGILFVTAQ